MTWKRWIGCAPQGKRLPGEGGLSFAIFLQKILAENQLRKILRIICAKICAKPVKSGIMDFKKGNPLHFEDINKTMRGLLANVSEDGKIQRAVFAKMIFPSNAVIII